jgi:hypothetical protein
MDRIDLVDKRAIATLVLAMDIGGNTSPHRNSAVPRLNRQIEPARTQELVQRK